MYKYMYNGRDIFFPSQLRFGFLVDFGLLTLGRTRKVIPPPWHKGGGGGGGEVDETSSVSFQWKAFDLLYKRKYILLVVALLEAYDVTI